MTQPPDLSSLQLRFRDALLVKNTPSKFEYLWLQESNLETNKRLQIHQNTIRDTLIDAIIAVYPLSARMLGEKMMDGLAASFLAYSPPDSAVLSDWGGGLACFFETTTASDRFPYMPDFMRLEWAIHQSQHAADYTSASRAKPNSQVEHESNSVDNALCSVPSAFRVFSEYPLLDLWMVASGQLPPEALHLQSGAQAVMILRNHKGVQLFAWSEDDEAFFTKILEEHTHREKGIQHWTGLWKDRGLLVKRLTNACE